MLGLLFCVGIGYHVWGFYGVLVGVGVWYGIECMMFE